MSNMAAIPSQEPYSTYSLSYPGYAFVDPDSFQDNKEVLFTTSYKQQQQQQHHHHHHQQCSFEPVADQIPQPYILSTSYPPTMCWAPESDDGLGDYYDSSSTSTVSSPEQSVYNDFNEAMGSDVNAWPCSEETFSTQASSNFLLTSEFDISAQNISCMSGLNPFTGDYDAAALLAPQTADQMKIIMYEPSGDLSALGPNFEVLPQPFDGLLTPAPSPKAIHQQSDSLSNTFPTTMPPSPPTNALDLNFGGAIDASGPYSNFNNLTAVMRCTHPGCPKTFSRIYNLKAHLKSHISTKPFDCQMCSRSFSRKHDLQRHVRVHTGAKPYICPCCKKGFARTDALKRHLRIEESCRMSAEVQSMKSRRRYSDL